MAAKLKKGDKVIVITGSEKGKSGEITAVMPSEGRAIVSGLNMVIRHERQTQRTQGGRVSKEAAISLSNLALLDPKTGTATRVGFKMVDGKKVRVAKKSGEVIDG